jgi:hypothetical protein
MNRILMLLIVASFSTFVETSGQSTTFDSLYWVVETNIHNPSYSIVRFYNHENLMVHEVRLQGVYLNICNPRQRKKLDSLMREYSQRVVRSKEIGSRYTLKVSSRLLRRSQL